MGWLVNPGSGFTRQIPSQKRGVWTKPFTIRGMILQVWKMMMCTAVSWDSIGILWGKSGTRDEKTSNFGLKSLLTKNWLVVGFKPPRPEKWWSASIGMIFWKPNTNGKIKLMFQSSKPPTRLYSWLEYSPKISEFYPVPHPTYDGLLQFAKVGA